MTITEKLDELKKTSTNYREQFLIEALRVAVEALEKIKSYKHSKKALADIKSKLGVTE